MSFKLNWLSLLKRKYKYRCQQGIFFIIYYLNYKLEWKKKTSLLCTVWYPHQRHPVMYGWKCTKVLNSFKKKRIFQSFIWQHVFFVCYCCHCGQIRPLYPWKSDQECLRCARDCLCLCDESVLASRNLLTWAADWKLLKQVLVFMCTVNNKSVWQRSLNVMLNAKVELRLGRV